MLRNRDDFYNAADYDLEIESRFLARQQVPDEDLQGQDALLDEDADDRLFVETFYH